MATDNELYHRQIEAAGEEIEAETNRRLIVYAADFKKGSPYAPPIIEPDDKVGFSDLVEGLEREPLDILIRSTGGLAEVAEELVGMLRANFESIRFVVPDRAMSAATLMCLAGDSIIMDERSFLGPIDIRNLKVLPIRAKNAPKT